MTPVKVPAKKRPRGGQRIFDEGSFKFIGCKATEEQHATFLALGGSEWLRETLDREAKRLARKKPPAGDRPPAP